MAGKNLTSEQIEVALNSVMVDTSDLKSKHSMLESVRTKIEPRCRTPYTKYQDAP